MSKAIEEAIEAAACQLLTTTERLFEAMAEGAEPESVVEVYRDRESSFEAFRDAVERAGGPRQAPMSVLARDALQRVSSFDADLIAAGTALIDGMRDEKRELGKVRSAIQKHSVREREQPRVVTIKA